MKTKDCHLPARNLKTGGASEENIETFFSDENSAIREAETCLAGNFCESCDLCRYFCPDLCITRNSESGLIEIDLDFCKGCGICAFICPKGAISMVRET